MKWIKASERLPKNEYINYVIRKGNDMYIAVFSKEIGWEFVNNGKIAKNPLEYEWLDESESTLPEKTYSEEERDRFAADILRFISEWDTQYSVMYGKQAERFADLETDYTPEQIIEIYKSKQ